MLAPGVHLTDIALRDRTSTQRLATVRAIRCRGLSSSWNNDESIFFAAVVVAVAGWRTYKRIPKLLPCDLQILQMEFHLQCLLRATFLRYSFTHNKHLVSREIPKGRKATMTINMTAHDSLSSQGFWVSIPQKDLIRRNSEFGPHGTFLTMETAHAHQQKL